MKIMQWLATIGLVMAGVVLLVTPVHAQAFVSPRFTVVDAGTVGRPDVVLIPGLSSSRAVWDGEVKLLAPNYRLHLVQVNGFAGQPAGANAMGEMLPEIVEELHRYCSSLLVVGHLRPVVMGHSLGGLLGMMLAEKYPLDMRKLVVVDTLPFYAVLFSPGATVENVKPMATGIRAHMISMPAEEYAAGEETMLKSMSNTEAGQKAIMASALTSDHAVVAEALYEDLLTDLRPEVGKIKTPTLVLYEFDDSAKGQNPLMYEATVKDGYKAMPNVTLVRVEGSRHFIMYDQPAKFDAAVEGFLK